MGFHPRSRAACVRAVPALVLLAAAFLSCGSPARQSEVPASTAAPILLIGVDGLEWDVLLPLLREGRLPHLARLMKAGTYGCWSRWCPQDRRSSGPRLPPARNPSSTKSSTSPIWTVKHQRLYTNSDRRSRAGWNILSDYGKRVAVVGWWMTYPVEEVNGVMVAQTNTAEQLDAVKGQHIWKGTLLEGVPGQVWPVERQNEFMALLRESRARLPWLTREIFGDFEHPLSPLDQQLWDHCQWAFRADATYLRISLALAREQPRFDLAMVYFGGPDVVGHRFWRFLRPELYRHPPGPTQLANFGRVIPDYYAYVDSSIGELVEAFGPQATVLIISDHGMEPTNKEGDFTSGASMRELNSAHHVEGPPGVLIAAGPHVRRRLQRRDLRQLTREDLPVLGSVYDITPTLLALLRIPLGKDMGGRVMDALATDGFNIAAQPEAVTTHDTPEFLASRPSRGQRDPMEEERLRQLRSLGYVE